MKRNSNRKDKTLKIVRLAFLSALIVVLQILSYFIKIGPFSMSLVLIPIAIGGIAMGPAAGAFLGGVFGLVAFVAGLVGFDAGTLIMIEISPFLTVLIAFGKGIIAGLVSALIYVPMKRFDNKYLYLSSIPSAIATPIVNTGLFFCGMLLFFKDTLISWAGGKTTIVGIFTAVIGWNFLVELLLNLILCPVLCSYLSKNRYFKQMF